MRSSSGGRSGRLWVAWGRESRAWCECGRSFNDNAFARELLWESFCGTRRRGPGRDRPDSPYRHGPRRPRTCGALRVFTSRSRARHARMASCP
ncbi:hypothetical protein [Lysobacter gummosus]|uniref:hypothetical protein n=1 Tax=Lysobacter gummosus TaxID=262324 RepID=UPI0036419E00